ncbi:transcriptional regulator [Methanocella sp. CWC-04]|uniref:Transcriptional regulator n=1 Tax=Methanooceanicella nereidis TaxID=2052831 RepID=A0AAP2RDD1_9EURY|nr:metalloregulator ArsR/SmtB family transcription factor [Methanocella sp. CWC-04]MCD1295238.1 transcriptional regulator [Methanocella sp. CWC-04]
MEKPDDDCEVRCVHPETVRKARSKQMSEETVERLSEIFKVMGDPTRLKIINALSAGEMCVCDLANVIGMEHSATSHQLRILKALRLVKYRKQGKSAYYSLDDEHVLTLFKEGWKHVHHE